MNAVDSNQKELVLGQDKIILYAKRSRMVLIALGSLLFVGAGFFIGSFDHDSPFPRNLRIIISILAIGFFGFCFLYAAYRIAVRQPALTLSREGLLDNSSAVSAGLIHWEEIERIYCSSLRGQQFVSIAVKDSDGFLLRMGGIKAKLMRMNIGLLGAPINLPVVTLSMSSEDLVKLIQSFRDSQGV